MRFLLLYILLYSHHTLCRCITLLYTSCSYSDAPETRIDCDTSCGLYSYRNSNAVTRRMTTGRRHIKWFFCEIVALMVLAILLAVGTGCACCQRPLSNPCTRFPAKLIFYHEKKVVQTGWFGIQTIYRVSLNWHFNSHLILKSGFSLAWRCQASRDA